VATLSRQQIRDAIVQADKRFASVVEAVGLPPTRRPAAVDERFGALIRSITFQLLATAAANTIHARVTDACGGTISPESVLAAGAERLKAAGLNRAKSEAMVALAERVAAQDIHLDRHGRMDDAAIVKELTVVKGVGPWTVQMYLMHTLGRRDVWPVGDYGVRMGWTILHDLPEMISERDLKAEGDPFTGVRSDVAWYCWQAVHLARNAK